MPAWKALCFNCHEVTVLLDVCVSLVECVRLVDMCSFRSVGPSVHPPPFPHAFRQRYLTHALNYLVIISPCFAHVNGYIPFQVEVSFVSTCGRIEHPNKTCVFFLPINDCMGDATLFESTLVIVLVFEGQTSYYRYSDLLHFRVPIEK